MKDNLAPLKKFIKFVRDTWIILGIAALMLTVIEAGFSLGFYIRSVWHSPYVDDRIKADTYTDTSWVAPYYHESEQMGKMRWEPYVYWRRKPYRGNYVNVNSDGIRTTANATESDGANPAMKVFMFGGSTMWGAGAKDDSTIPSIFAKEVSNGEASCDVVNFGVEAYVSTQEVIALMLQLQRGNIPDVIIFYDGVNDASGAFQLGVPGLPHNEFNRVKEFSLLERKEIRTLAVQAAANELSTVRFFKRLFMRLGLQRESPFFNPLEYEKPILDRAALVRATVETYLSNVALVQVLSRSYGFKCLFYWQPMIYQKQHLTEYEQHKAAEFEKKFPGLKGFYLETYAFLKQRTVNLKGDFHDISSIFSDVHEPLYVDQFHLGEKGNSLIAKRMVEDFAHLVRVNK